MITQRETLLKRCNIRKADLDGEVNVMCRTGYKIQEQEKCMNLKRQEYGSNTRHNLQQVGSTGSHIPDLPGSWALSLTQSTMNTGHEANSE